MNNEMSVVLGTVAMEPKGEYDSSTYYEKLNVVSYNNSTYMATQPSQGIAPTNPDFWQFISSSGLAESDVIDNLESTETNKPLSAKQGNVLDKKIGSECEFIFPGQWGVNKASGNSNIVKIKDKVLMFDANSQSVYSYLIDMLEENNITHIDYFILTHFDSDHRGNLNSLITDGYIDENSYYIHPECLTEIYGQAVKNWSNTLEARCTELGITSIIPEENQVIEVNDELSLRFGNVDSTYSLANYTNPNQASMITEVNHNGFCALMMGDALVATEKHLVESQFIKNSIGLYTIPHHAIESTCYTPFYDLIQPKFAVGQSAMMNFNINLFATNQSTALLEEKGCINYFGFNNPTNIKFIERFGNIECVNGISTAQVGRSFKTLYLYCDSENYDEGRQDGSEEYPFKDLPQALGVVRDWDNAYVVINLKPGHYGNAYTGSVTTNKNCCMIHSRKNHIFITGEDADTTIIDNGFNIQNSRSVFIKNVTIKPYEGDESICAYTLASKVLFLSCKFVGKDTDNITGSGIRTAYLSDISSIGCEFSYLNIAYNIYGASRLVTNKDKISNLNYFIQPEESCDINIGTILGTSDLTTVTNFDNYNSSKTVLSKPRKYSTNVNSIMTGDITLPVTSQNFIYKNLVVHYSLMSNSSSIGEGKKIIPFLNTTNLIISEQVTNNNNTIDTFSMKATITNKIFRITQNININIASNGTLTSHAPATSNDTSYGIKITKIDLI